MPWLAGLVSALLPEEPRRALVRRYGVEPLLWSALLGLLELLGGGLALVDSFLRTVPALVDRNTAAFLDHPPSAALLDHGATRLAFYWSGAWSWALWAASPLTLLLYAIAAVGGLRLVAYAVSGEALAEPVVWLGWRAWRLARSGSHAARHAARFGPARPDLVLSGEEGELLVLTAKPRGEWNDRIAIEVGDRFYRLAAVDERVEQGRRWHCHHLREESSAEVLRGLVRYHPPPPGAGGPAAG